MRNSSIRTFPVAILRYCRSFRLLETLRDFGARLEKSSRLLKEKMATLEDRLSGAEAALAGAGAELLLLGANRFVERAVEDEDDEEGVAGEQDEGEDGEAARSLSPTPEEREGAFLRRLGQAVASGARKLSRGSEQVKKVTCSL